MQKFKDEIVVCPDIAGTPAQIAAILKANHIAKLKHATRREQERFDAPSVLDKILDLLVKSRADQTR